jgi:chromosomal replication initiator protein
MRNGFNHTSDVNQWPEVWQAAYRILEQSVVPHQLQTWIQPLELISTENSDSGLKIQLAAPNDFTADWVRGRFKRAIETAFSQVTGSMCEVVLTVREPLLAGAEGGLLDTTTLVPMTDPSEPPLATSFLAPPAAPSHNVSVGAVLSAGSRAMPEADRTNELEPRYTFESFVVGASNQFAHASAVAVAEQPARQYNPLFLYSPPGLGKTHLLHAIGNHLIAKRPGARVAYLSAEKFVNELIESIQHRRMSQFRAKYRDSYDMILIDEFSSSPAKRRAKKSFSTRSTRSTARSGRSSSPATVRRKKSKGSRSAFAPVSNGVWLPIFRLRKSRRASRF